MDTWKSFVVNPKTTHFQQIGPLKLWITYKNQEWLVASEYALSDLQNFTSQELEEAGSDLEWKRFVVPGQETEVRLSPTPLDRSIVVQPESELTISSGAEALFFVFLPVHVRVSVGPKKHAPITEIPTQKLSNTWFGLPHNGELCYTLKTSARRSLEGVTPRPHQIVCPVFIKNTSPDDLLFSRLCIRTEYLTIYEGENWLWSNKVHVNFRGENRESKLKYSPTMPDFEKMKGKISSPRAKPSQDFSLKSFDTFKFFTGA